MYHREQYLSDAEFFSTFHMSKREFKRENGQYRFKLLDQAGLGTRGWYGENGSLN
jgi:hypothetical protein